MKHQGKISQGDNDSCINSDALTTRRFPKLFCGYFGKTIAWFRIFGYGLSIKDTKHYPLLFSERHGHRKGLKLGRYIIHGLR